MKEHQTSDEPNADEAIACPFCGSSDVRLEQRRGSALCRTLYVCQSCSQPFEKFS